MLLPILTLTAEFLFLPNSLMHRSDWCIGKAQLVNYIVKCELKHWPNKLHTLCLFLFYSGVGTSPSMANNRCLCSGQANRHFCEWAEPVSFVCASAGISMSLELAQYPTSRCLLLALILMLVIPALGSSDVTALRPLELKTFTTTFPWAQGTMCLSY